MSFQWTPEQSDTRNKYAEIGKNVAARFAPGRFDRLSWSDLTEAGFWRLPVARDYGGAGRSFREIAAGLEGLAYEARDFGFLLSVMAQTGTIQVVCDFGTEEQKSQLLPKLMEGVVASTASTEPQGGSDVARVATAAERRDGRLLLSGQKSPITNAPIADIFVIVGRIPELGARNDITLFVIERVDAVGLETFSGEPTLGCTTSPIGTIQLQDVPLEQTNILGQPGQGLELAYSILSLDRLLFCLVASAFGEFMLGQAMAFVRTRRSFGKPLWEHQYVQDKIVKIATNMQVARSLAQTALRSRLGGQPDSSLLCSIAKMVGTDGLCESAQEVVQLHGHAGYVDGPISRLLQDAIASRIAGGTNEMQKVNVFNQINRRSARAH